MQHTQFYRFGKLIYPSRWLIIGVWVLSMLACIPFLPNIIKPFTTTGFTDEVSDSAITQQYLNTKLGYNPDNQFLIIYRSSSLEATNPNFLASIKKSLSKLAEFPLKHEIIYPDANNKQISKDKHSAYVVVMIKKSTTINDALLAQFKLLIKKPSHMTMELGGNLIFVENVTKQTQVDLFKADSVATPVAVIILILVFGSLVAASLPILLGGGCALVILTTLYFLGHVITLSIFTINIALLLGLCLSLDYSLFIISRFRDELARGLTTAEAISVTQATAGKAIFFSGLAVFVSLSALLFFPVNILFSVAVGGLTAVMVAVLTAILFLPAVLSVLSHRINLGTVRLIKHKKEKKYANSWHWLAEKVVNNPLRCLFSILIVLLALGYPVFFAQFGVSDFHILPEQSEGRRFFDRFHDEFNGNDLTPISMVIQTQKSPILSRGNIAKLYNIGSQLKDNPLIAQVNSIVTTTPRLTKSQYYELYNYHANRMDPQIKQLLETTTRHYFTVLTIVGKYQINSTKMNTLITSLRKIHVGHGMTEHLTGTPVSNDDVVTIIAELLPFTLLWIMGFTYLILLLLLRSLFLPLKAIVMNLLSLSACYGALVLVFQEGYFYHLLNFQPQQRLDISLVVIIFCALFGFSMDYEVFLLTRIKEAYESCKDNKKSIVFGIEKSSRIITSAAVVVIFLCGSFLVADVLMVKAFGLGIAVAIFVDAFLIRTVLVPATMTLLERWNWYLPRWLDRILPKI